MRVSTIDVGTNTVRLLVADVEGPGAWRVVTQHQTVTRLGEGLAASGALGVAPLAERFPFRGRVDPDGFAGLLGEVRGRLARELPAAIRGARPAHLVGTAGTVTTLGALDLGLRHYDPRRVQGHTLARAAIEAQRARLASLSAAERADLPCLEPGRADLILPGIAVVLATLDEVA